MNPTQVAIYARVSSAQQAEAHTVASQVAALRERVAADGFTVSAAMQFLEEEYSGATLVRPALERLRDVIAAGSVDRLYVHSPDRLARLAEEYRRRLQPETCAKCTPLATIEDQLSKVRQGVARLIDSYAERLIDKSEFALRITRLRQRLARLEEQRQTLAEEAALQGELELMIGRLEDFAATLHDGLETADWASQRDLIRALVKRVEVTRNEVNIVFRIDPYPGDGDPEKKVCNFVGREISVVLSNVYLHYVLDRWFERGVKPQLQGEAYLVRYLETLWCASSFGRTPCAFRRHCASGWESLA